MPRHPDELSEAPLARQVTVGLSKLGLALRTHAWRESGPRGLNPTQAQILALLLADHLLVVGQRAGRQYRALWDRA